MSFEKKLESIANKLLDIPRRGILPTKKRKTHSDGREYSTLTSRIMAMTLDMFLAFLLLSIPFIWISNMLFPQSEEIAIQTSALIHAVFTGTITLQEFFIGNIHSGFFTKAAVDYVVQGSLSGVLIVYSWVRFGTSPGMWLMRAEMVDATTGERPARRQFIIRYISGMLTIPFFMIGFLWVAIDKKSQAWHDKFANTVVLYVPYGFMAKFKKQPAETEEKTNDDETAS